MSAVATLGMDRWRAARPSAGVLWLGALAISLAWTLVPRGTLPAWATSFPRAWQWGLARELSAWMRWLVNDASLGFVTVKELTRGFAGLLDWPLWFATSLLATGFMDGQGSTAAQVLPPLPWLAVVALAALAGGFAGGWRLALLAGGCLAYLVAFGQWASAMTTLAAIAVAVPLGAVGGLLLGIAAFRHPALERGLNPLLDLMQTVPTFAYLVPVLFFFGFGPVAALIATIVYAMPPMVRVTVLALRGVPEETVEYGRMAGCTTGQLTWRVLVPSARPMLMVGVNQVIMLSLNMVIIASMIGAGGLGYDVLTALRRLDIGAGLEAGLAITALAVVLDRVSQAMAERAPRTGDGDDRPPPAAAASAARRRRAGGAGSWPALADWPDAWHDLDQAVLGSVVGWLNVHYFDQLEAVSAGPSQPDAAGQAVLPGPAMAGDPAGRARRAGGWAASRLAALCTALALFVARHRPVGAGDDDRLSTAACRCSSPA